MKRFYWTVISVCITMLVVCSGKNEYIVTGSVPSGIDNGEVVFMIDYNNGLIVDSARVSNGKFVFKGIADNAVARSLSIGQFQVDIILDKGAMTVDMTDPYSVKGNPLTEKLNDYYLKCGVIIMEKRNKLAEIDESLSEDEIGQMQEAIVDELFAEIDELHVLFLREHPNDALGAMIFYIWMQNQMELSMEWFTEASRLVGEYVLNFGPVKQKAEEFESLAKTAVGRPFVDFTVEAGNRDGSAVSLSDYVGKGKYILVDFWASWCMPCRVAAPAMKELYNKYKGDRFEIVSIAVWDQREASLLAIEEDGYSWSQVLDGLTIPTDLYGINAIPHLILFGPDGEILARDYKLDGEIMGKIAEAMK